MEIQPQRPLQSPQRSVGKKRISSASSEGSSSEPADGADVALMGAIAEGLAALEEVRQERLDAGRKLAADPDYPNQQQRDELCRLALLSHSTQTDGFDDAEPESPMPKEL